MNNFEADAKRIRMLKESIAAYEAELKDITARYADTPDDKYVAGDLILVVSHQERFDPATAQRSLTKAQFASILKPKPDALLAKAVLPYNDDKPHRCPACHAVTDADRRAARAVVTCCRCGALFTWSPELAAELPHIGIVCAEWLADPVGHDAR